MIRAAQTKGSVIRSQLGALLGVGISLLTACAGASSATRGPELQAVSNAAPIVGAPESQMPGALEEPVLELQEPQAQSTASPTDPKGHVVPRCPEGMAHIERAVGDYCIDRFEATLERQRARGKQWPANRTVEGIEEVLIAVSVPGRIPQGYISGEQAAQACENAGKRLCEPEEWVQACRGPNDTQYPYGNQRRAGQCNDRFEHLDAHPVVRLFHQYAPAGADPNSMWQMSWMNDPRLFELPRTVSKTGEFANCTNGYGVYDMVGNLHEWVADPEGTFLGGFFMDTFQNGEGCSYRTTFHAVSYHDYSTGFRCCADLRSAG